MMDRSDKCVCCQEIPEMLSLNEEVMIIKKIKDPLLASPIIQPLLLCV